MQYLDSLYLYIKLKENITIHTKASSIQQIIALSNFHYLFVITQSILQGIESLRIELSIQKNDASYFMRTVFCAS